MATPIYTDTPFSVKELFAARRKMLAPEREAGLRPAGKAEERVAGVPAEAGEIEDTILFYANSFEEVKTFFVAVRGIQEVRASGENKLNRPDDAVGRLVYKRMIDCGILHLDGTLTNPAVEIENQNFEIFIDRGQHIVGALRVDPNGIQYADSRGVGLPEQEKLAIQRFYFACLLEADARERTEAEVKDLVEERTHIASNKKHRENEAFMSARWALANMEAMSAEERGFADEEKSLEDMQGYLHQQPIPGDSTRSYLFVNVEKPFAQRVGDLKQIITKYCKAHNITEVPTLARKGDRAVRANYTDGYYVDIEEQVDKNQLQVSSLLTKKLKPKEENPLKPQQPDEWVTDEERVIDLVERHARHLATVFAATLVDAKKVPITKDKVNSPIVIDSIYLDDKDLVAPGAEAYRKQVRGIFEKHFNGKVLFRDEVTLELAAQHLDDAAQQKLQRSVAEAEAANTRIAELQARLERTQAEAASHEEAAGVQIDRLQEQLGAQTVAAGRARAETAEVREESDQAIAQARAESAEAMAQAKKEAEDIKRKAAFSVHDAKAALDDANERAEAARAETERALAERNAAREVAVEAGARANYFQEQAQQLNQAVAERDVARRAGVEARARAKWLAEQLQQLRQAQGVLPSTTGARGQYDSAGRVLRPTDATSDSESSDASGSEKSDEAAAKIEEALLQPGAARAFHAEGMESPVTKQLLELTAQRRAGAESRSSSAAASPYQPVPPKSERQAWRMGIQGSADLAAAATRSPSAYAEPPGSDSDSSGSQDEIELQAASYSLEAQGLAADAAFPASSPSEGGLEELEASIKLDERSAGFFAAGRVFNEVDDAPAATAKGSTEGKAPTRS